jgi:glucose-6-phosphate isomerase
MDHNNFHYQPGKYSDAVNSTLAKLREERIVFRIWDHDYTVWKDDPEGIINRLGWLSSAEKMRGAVPRIEEMVRKVCKDGYTDVLLLGMGGSSLAPDLFSKVFGTREGYLDLKVLDSTDPAAIMAHSESLDLTRTLFIVSTKSGTTTETLSFFKYFYNLVADAEGSGSAGDHFVAITDPGSPLQPLALDLGFRDIYLNNPDIGGRYSALSFFGLVPAALLGIDIRLLLDRAAGMADTCKPYGSNVGDNAGEILGAVMGALHNRGVNKLTLIASPSIFALGAWLEQLLAESTGKEGKGIVPVDGELTGWTNLYGTDRLFTCLRVSGDTTSHPHVKALEEEGHPVVTIELTDLYSIAAEFFRWEIATAVAGHIMGINPFDQPDVESAKIQARRMLQEYRDRGQLPGIEPVFVEDGVEVYSDLSTDSLSGALGTFFRQVRSGDYAAIQAYVNPTIDTSRALEEFRHRIRDKYRIATTLGFGPRFLHSTGQLHKGDGGKGLFIQITADDPVDLPIPDEAGKDGSSITFGVLKASQALGDRQALIDAGRRIIRFHLKGDIPEGIRVLKEAIN